LKLEEILEDNLEHAIAIRCLRMRGTLASVSGLWEEKEPTMGRTMHWCPPLYYVMTNKNPSLSRGTFLRMSSIQLMHWTRRRKGESNPFYECPINAFHRFQEYAKSLNEV
jgi:hypothetical protein